MDSDRQFLCHVLQSVRLKLDFLLIAINGILLITSMNWDRLEICVCLSVCCWYGNYQCFFVVIFLNQCYVTSLVLCKTLASISYRSSSTTSILACSSSHNIYTEEELDVTSWVILHTSQKTCTTEIVLVCKPEQYSSECKMIPVALLRTCCSSVLEELFLPGTFPSAPLFLPVPALDPP